MNDPTILYPAKLFKYKGGKQSFSNMNLESFVPMIYPWGKKSSLMKFSNK